MRAATPIVDLPTLAPIGDIDPTTVGTTSGDHQWKRATEGAGEMGSEPVTLEFALPARLVGLPRENDFILLCDAITNGTRMIGRRPPAICDV